MQKCTPRVIWLDDGTAHVFWREMLIAPNERPQVKRSERSSDLLQHRFSSHRNSHQLLKHTNLKHHLDNTLCCVIWCSLHIKIKAFFTNYHGMKSLTCFHWHRICVSPPAAFHWSRTHSVTGGAGPELSVSSQTERVDLSWWRDERQSVLPYM